MIKLEYDDKEFPYRLRNIINPPKQLYVNGNKEILNNNLIAVVGSRANTEYGKKWCEKICMDLLKYNINIVSGMALGIDSIAHRTSILEGIPTVAVLPSGLNNIYPKNHLELYNNIISEGGVVISEYEPNANASSKNFIERNRIVAGLSIGVLVVEAAHRSGTSITARIAKEHGKNVFCVPGNLENSKSIGTNRLIQDGAILVTSAEDIVNKYVFIHKIKTKRRARIKKEEIIDEQYKKIYDCIPEEGININDIANLNNLNLAEVIEAITVLEINGKIIRKAGNKYIRV